jgi:hypothetical protein
MAYQVTGSPGAKKDYGSEEMLRAAKEALVLRTKRDPMNLE